jgi:CheY-like chemotaxis protein
MRVLVVEDDADIRKILDRHFREQNRHSGERLEVTFCDGLRTGLEENLVKHPDVVLLDLGLHDSPSDKTAAAIAQFTGHPAPAVVVLTGNERPELVAKCFTAGADSYLHKAILAARFEFLFSVLLNASLRRRHTPSYARPRH